MRFSYGVLSPSSSISISYPTSLVIRGLLRLICRQSQQSGGLIYFGHFHANIHSVYVTQAKVP